MKHARARSLPAMAAALLALAVSACDGGSSGSGTPEDMVARGEDVYARCVTCHLADRPLNRAGPHLVGIFGRQAGAVEDFRYSEPMRSSGIVWTEETIAELMRHPRTFIPGNRMAFAGLRDEEDIAALLAYMKQATEPKE